MLKHLLRQLCITGLVLFSALVLASCDSSEKPASQQGPTPTPAAPQAETATVSTQSRSGKIDPCVLTKDEVEAAVGRSVLAPLQQEDAAIASCDYRDPVATANGNSHLIYRTVGVRVLVGGGSDYGPDAVAKAKSAYATGKKDAAEPQSVAAIGEDAYWDRFISTLSVLRGRYELKIAVKADSGALDIAKTLAVKALDRLP